MAANDRQAEAIMRLGHNPWREVVERSVRELCPRATLTWPQTTINRGAWTHGDVFAIVSARPSFVREGAISRWDRYGSFVKLGLFLGGGWDGDLVEIDEDGLRDEIRRLVGRW